MPIEKRSPNVRPDGTSPPRETALTINWLVQQVLAQSDRIAQLETRIASLEAASAVTTGS